MDAAAVLALYDARMRADPPDEVGVVNHWAGSVLRRQGERDFIEHWRFDSEGAPGAVAVQANHYRRMGRRLEWRVFSHDQPDNLERVLADAGFIPDPAETLMVLDMTIELDAPALPPGAAVRHAIDAAGLDDLLAVRAAAFGKNPPGLAREMEGRLADPAQALYVAYWDGRPVASARLDCPPERPFASLYGGGVRPEFRGRGLYRALVAARAGEARRRGVEYLTVDAAETSRPILERLGFQALARIRGWVI